MSQPNYPRKFHRPFAGQALAAPGGIGQFGSLANGAPLFTTDPVVIEGLPAWDKGWGDASVGNFPAREDRNAVAAAHSYHEAYIYQKGIPEWETNTTYFTGAFVQVSGVLYQSTVDNNTGNAPGNVRFPFSTNPFWKVYSPTPAYDLTRWWTLNFDLTGHFPVGCQDLSLSGNNESTGAPVQNISNNGLSLFLVGGTNANWGELLSASKYHLNQGGDEFFSNFFTPNVYGSAFIGMISDDPTNSAATDITTILDNLSGYGVIVENGVQLTALANNGGATPVTAAFGAVAAGQKKVKMEMGSTILFNKPDHLTFTAENGDTTTLTGNKITAVGEQLRPIVYLVWRANGGNPEIPVMSLQMRFEPKDY